MQNRLRNHFGDLLENLGFFASTKLQLPKVDQHRLLAVKENLTSLDRQRLSAFFFAYLDGVDKV